MSASELSMIPGTRIQLAGGSQAWFGGHCSFAKEWTNLPHHHTNYHEFCLVIRGSGQFIHGAETYHLQRGSLFVSDLNIVHEIQSQQTKDLELVFIVWKPYVQNGHAAPNEPSYLQAFRQAHRIHTTGQQHLESFLPALQAIGPSDAINNCRRQQVLQSFLITCAVALTVLDHAAETQTQLETIQQAEYFIRQNLLSDLHVADVARSVDRSERQLRRLFQKHLDCTVVQAITIERLRQATRFLVMRFSVSEAARRVGFSSPSMFSRLFKKHYGHPPRAWQKEHAPKHGGAATEFGQQKNP